MYGYNEKGMPIMQSGREAKRQISPVETAHLARVMGKAQNATDGRGSV